MTFLSTSTHLSWLCQDETISIESGSSLAWTEMLMLDLDERISMSTLNFFLSTRTQPDDCWLSWNILLHFVCNFLGDKARSWCLSLEAQSEIYRWMEIWRYWEHLFETFLICLLHPYVLYIDILCCIFLLAIYYSHCWSE